MRTLLLITFVFMVFQTQVLGQDTARYEVGLRGISISLPLSLSSSFFLKKKIGDNKYRRYTTALGHISVNKLDTLSGSSFNELSFQFGTEKRAAIKNKLSFIHGLQYLLNAKLNATKLNTPSQTGRNWRVIPSVGIGYVLGLMYSISPQFNFGIETMPSAIMTVTFDRQKIGSMANSTTNYDFSGDFNLSNVALFAAYRF